MEYHTLVFTGLFDRSGGSPALPACRIEITFGKVGEGLTKIRHKTKINDFNDNLQSLRK